MIYKEMSGKNDLFFLYLASIVCFVSNIEGCGDIGASSPSAHIAMTGAHNDQTFFVESSTSTCCGLLTTWKFYASSAGDVTVHQWRQSTTTTSNYELISRQTVTAAVGLNAFSPATPVLIETGDNIGWGTTGAELIPSSATGGSITQNQQLAAGTPAVGVEIPWSLTQDTTNTYAFGAVITSNEVPAVAIDSVTITNSMTSQSIFTIHVTDADTADLLDSDTGLTVTKVSGSSDFSVVTTATGFDIESGSSLTSGSYPVVVQATDRCGDTATATIIVIVSNTIPVFDPNPLQTVHPSSISDVTTAGTSLYTFSVTDTDTITCSADNTKFEIQTVGTTEQNHPNETDNLKTGALTGGVIGVVVVVLAAVAIIVLFKRRSSQKEAKDYENKLETTTPGKNATQPGPYETLNTSRMKKNDRNDTHTRLFTTGQAGITKGASPNRSAMDLLNAVGGERDISGAYEMLNAKENEMSDTYNSLFTTGQAGDTNNDNFENISMDQLTISPESHSYANTILSE